MGNLENIDMVNMTGNSSTRHIKCNNAPYIFAGKTFFFLSRKNFKIGKLSTRISVRFWQNSGIVPTSDTTVLNYSVCMNNIFQVFGHRELSSIMAIVQRSSWQFEFWCVLPSKYIGLVTSGIPGWGVRLYTIIITISLVHLWNVSTVSTKQNHTHFAY